MSVLKRTKVFRNGGAKFVDTTNGASITVSARMFVDGVAPDTIEFTAENLAPPNEKAVARVLRGQDQAARYLEKATKAQERIKKQAAQLAKAQERAEKQAVRLAKAQERAEKLLEKIR
jgi:ATPase subunit of ABC transporter with duplicated ATPase domains